MSWLLPRLVGLRRAQEIILTNRRIKADEAAAIGMVTRLTDDSELAAADKISAIIWTIKIVLAMMSTEFRNRSIRDALSNRNPSHSSSIRSGDQNAVGAAPRRLTSIMNQDIGYRSRLEDKPPAPRQRTTRRVAPPRTGCTPIFTLRPMYNNSRCVNADAP
jgi:enoyl-CoA hydratase/carnithine racemase